MGLTLGDITQDALAVQEVEREREILRCVGAFVSLPSSQRIPEFDAKGNDLAGFLAGNFTKRINRRKQMR